MFLGVDKRRNITRSKWADLKTALFRFHNFIFSFLFSSQTLQRIKEFNFSVGIFAPAWTFERILDIGLDPFNPRGSDVCNHHFMHRDHLFWTLLWKHMHTSGPVALPFYTSFCLGSGVKKFRDGIQTLNEPWFNLMEQEYQPSVPSVYEYNFDEAYHGGSCVRFISDVHRLRLFCSDFSCENQIVAAFVLKRTSPQIHCQLVLKVIAENGNSFTFIHCDNDAITVGESSIDVPGDKRIAPLKGISLQRVILKLSRRQERLFSTQTQVNNWEAYYFYLKFASDVKRCRIVDVGVSIAKDDGWHERDFLLLGAIHMHEGFEHDEHIVGTSELQINRNNFIDWDHKIFIFSLFSYCLFTFTRVNLTILLSTQVFDLFLIFFMKYFFFLCLFQSTWKVKWKKEMIKIG